MEIPPIQTDQNSYVSPIMVTAPESPKPTRRKSFAFFGLIAGILLVVLGSLYAVEGAPSDFKPGTVVVIASNASTKSAAGALQDAHVIRSTAVFEFVVQIIYSDRPIMAGQFQFDEPVDTLAVAERLTGGIFGRSQVKFTVPEGSSVSDIAEIAAKVLPGFDSKSFIALAKPHEGYLFPETYFFFKTIAPNEIADRMEQEFDKKIAPLQADITASKHSESDIVTMASILEKEAKNASDAARIAGILWHRLAIGMPLQVDAAPVTYTKKGLPSPIGNPGIAMINAALHPISSDYVYYLYDKKGLIHYAKTYTEHQSNIKKYLK